MKHDVVVVLVTLWLPLRGAKPVMLAVPRGNGSAVNSKSPGLTDALIGEVALSENVSDLLTHNPHVKVPAVTLPIYFGSGAVTLHGVLLLLATMLLFRMGVRCSDVFESWSLIRITTHVFWSLTRITTHLSWSLTRINTLWFWSLTRIITHLPTMMMLILFKLIENIRLFNYAVTIGLTVAIAGIYVYVDKVLLGIQSKKLRRQVMTCYMMGKGTSQFPRSDPGQHQIMNSMKVPPAWDPSWERSYPFKAWIRDISMWSLATDLSAAQQCASVILRLGGTARDLASNMNENQVAHGDNVDFGDGQGLVHIEGL